MRDGGPESERAASEEKTATSAGSYLDEPFVLWKEPYAHACTSAPHMLDSNGWATLFLVWPYILLQGTGEVTQVGIESIDSDTSDSVD